MKKLLDIIILLTVVLTASALDKQQAKVNDIKKNKEYLYSEATMPTQEEAASIAYEQIQHEVLSWAASRVSRPIDNVSLKDINNLVDTFVLRRADMYRVFAYVKKNELVPMFYDKGLVLDGSLDLGIMEAIPQKPEEVKETTDTIEGPKPTEVKETKKPQKSLVDDKLKQELQRRFFGSKNSALRKIAEARNFFELKHILPPLKADGSIINYGKLATAEKLEECFLIVYDVAGNIKALLGRGEETRPNLKTGQEDRLENYRGCGAIWFTMKDKDLEN